MKGRPIGRAPDYTNAFLCMAWVWAMIVLITVWAMYGFMASLVVCVFAHTLLTRRLERNLKNNQLDP